MWNMARGHVTHGHVARDQWHLTLGHVKCDSWLQYNTWQHDTSRQSGVAGDGRDFHKICHKTRLYYTDTKLVRSLLFNLTITISTKTWFCRQVHCPSSLAKSNFSWKSDCLYEKYCANKRFTFFFSWEYSWLLQIKLAVISKPLIWQSPGIQIMFMDLHQ